MTLSKTKTVNWIYWIKSKSRFIYAQIDKEQKCLHPHLQLTLSSYCFNLFYNVHIQQWLTIHELMTIWKLSYILWLKVKLNTNESTN